MNEADLLNEIHDMKVDLNRLIARRRYCRDNDLRPEFRLIGINHEIGDLRDEIARARGQLWKGCKTAHTFKPMYSSGLCRTGRVRPKHPG